jgi:hypothetical protein
LQDLSGLIDLAEDVLPAVHELGREAGRQFANKHPELAVILARVFDVLFDELPAVLAVNLLHLEEQFLHIMLR